MKRFGFAFFTLPMPEEDGAEPRRNGAERTPERTSSLVEALERFHRARREDSATKPN